MEKENNKLRLKFSRMFTNSCRTQKISEVIDHQNPIFTTQTPLTKEEQERYSPVTKLKRTPLICKPRCPESLDLMVRENCIVSTPVTPSPRRKITGKYSLLSPAGDFSGHRCPPASPAASPLFQTTKKTKGKKKNSKPHLPNNHPFNFSSSNETDFFSSDDEREEEDEDKDAIDKTETLFSSLKSVSFSSKSASLSSDSDPGRVRTRTRFRNRRRRRRGRAAAATVDVGAVPLQGKVKNTFAVVKSSRDPYSDFRTSMVEMIMEKQIFGSKELEQLLQCFLSLNSPHHHRVILEVCIIQIKIQYLKNATIYV
ncbi:hypothetical protein Cgig2_018660 [Carnegiea gigantea]|uniref:Transcription repressor n=1 Tax=Carnegiea gigantea TaxID=171969 RepID=A0A9Q1KGF3_9CARY|nr:hypothetical protein Cgig2_018660 [Carnegiea gigantea]